MATRELKITVIIRTYNSAGIVERAIDSVFKQKLDKVFYEILVVDDGSKDNLEKELLKYENKIRLIKQNHLGPVKSANNGIINSRGLYIILLDSDDLFKPEILKEMLEVFEKEKNIDFVYCDYYEKFLDGKKKIVSLKNNLFNSLTGGIMFKKQTLKDIGMYDESFIFAEYDLLIRLLRKNYKGKHIASPLYTYNRTKNSLTSDKSKIIKAYEQLKEKYGDIKIRTY